MTTFKIPRTFMGEDGAKNYERIMNAPKKVETQRLPNLEGKIIELKEILTEKHPNQVDGIGFSPDGKYLATGCWDNNLRIYEFENKKLKEILTEEHPNQVNGIGFSPDGKYLATGCWDKNLRIYEFENKKLKEILTEKRPNSVYGVGFSP